MNNDIYRLFECLTSDLQLPLRTPRGVTQSILGELRNEFLLVLESELQSGLFDDSLKWGFYRKLSKYFVLNERITDLKDPEVVKTIYQVLCFTLKVQIPHTKEQERNYVSRLKENENSNRSWRLNKSCDVIRMARSCCRIAAQHWVLSAAALAGECRHGPGAVAGKEVGSDKNYWNHPPSDLLEAVGYDVFFANAEYLAEYNRLYSVGDPPTNHRRVVSRLALVPKDYKGPRGVFVSPKEAVFCQLGIDRILKRGVSSSWIGECYNPHDQTPSQEAALAASIDRRHATLDLSDASDRIPWTLARWLFPDPDFRMLWASRPSAVEIPGEPVRKLWMLAPMGDGKTFPVLTIISACISIAAMLVADGYVAARVPMEDTLRRYARRIRIFGDDIIVPSEYYAAVCVALERCNLKVNRAKSFYKGFFRESCGMDAYKGVCITPIRLRAIPDRAADLQSILKMVDLHNRIRVSRKSCSKTIARLRLLIETSGYNIGYTSRPDVVPDAIYCPESAHSMKEQSIMPYSDGARPVRLGKKDHKVRWCSHLQRYEQLVDVPVRVRNCMRSLDPWWDLNYWFLTNTGASQLAESKQLTYATDRRVVLGSPSAEEAWESFGRELKVGYSSRTPEYRATWIPLL